MMKVDKFEIHNILKIELTGLAIVTTWDTQALC